MSPILLIPRLLNILNIIIKSNQTPYYYNINIKSKNPKDTESFNIELNILKYILYVLFKFDFKKTFPRIPNEDNFC